MNYYKKIKNQLNRMALLFLSVAIGAFSLVSCEDYFEYDIAESYSIADITLPTASFSAIQSSGSGDDDWKDFTFGNSSSSSVHYVWDFGDGGSSSAVEPTHTFSDEGTYTVTLTASDNNGEVSTTSLDVEVVEPEPSEITPDILNGNFDGGQDNWKISSFSGGTTSPYNSSSDGSPNNYDGTPSGASKTPGAKWTTSTTAEPVSGSTRYAYQAITVTPNAEYVVQYEYSIKEDGDRVFVEILDGQYSDAVDAVASSIAGPLVQAVGTEALGKGTFTQLTVPFTSNDSGLVSIWMYAKVSPTAGDDVWIDNVKVIPVSEL